MKVSRIESLAIFSVGISSIYGMSYLALPFILKMDHIDFRFGSLVNMTIIFSMALFFGLKLSTNLPNSAVFYRKNKDFLKDITEGLLASLALGCAFVATDLIILSDFRDFYKFQSAYYSKYLLISIFYGGIVEEIICRFFFISFIFYIAKKFTSGDARNNLGLIFFSTILSSFFFALMHAPLANQMGMGDTEFILRSFILNFLSGSAFALLMFRHSMLSAMISHGTVHAAYYFFISTILGML